VDYYRLPCRLTFEGSRTPLTQYKLAMLIFYASGQPCADPVTHPTRAQILAWNDATARRANTAAQDGPGDAICEAVERWWDVSRGEDVYTMLRAPTGP
jgi:hypothetical protein